MSRTTKLMSVIYDHMQVVQKGPIKEHTKPADFKLRTQQRAVNRAIFNYTASVHHNLICFHDNLEVEN